MTQQKARVTRILDEGRAEVAVKRQSACGHDCAQCGGGCSELMVASEVRVVADNAAGARPGDTVTVESSTSRVLGAAVLVYTVPFLLFFVGYFLGAFLWGEGAGIAAGAVGLALGFVPAVLLDRQTRRRGSIQFRIVAVEQGS